MARRRYRRTLADALTAHEEALTYGGRDGIGNHGFVDANKRTDWPLVEILIDRSGYRLDIPEDEPIDDLVAAVAAGQMDFDDLIVWLSGRIEPR